MIRVGDWNVPKDVLHALEQIPSDRPVVWLVRHSVRGPLPDGPAAKVEPITPEGASLARKLGQHIGPRIRTLHASPLTRCMQTAAALGTGAGVEVPVVPDRLLGDPGAYVIDGSEAWKVWKGLGHVWTVAWMVSGSGFLPGMAEPDAAARFLVQHMFRIARGRPGLHVFVTHDSLVTATAARMSGRHLRRADWPAYLDGPFLWERDGAVCSHYHGVKARRVRERLCGLDEPDVVDFARREVMKVLGSLKDIHFHLAGGAFRALWAPTPTHDLDLWPASPRDRERLVDTLLERGAEPLPRRPFSEAFRISDRVVEVADRIHPSIEDCVTRFDLALSAVGVEFFPGGTWRVFIHPRARQGLARREVRALWPLRNWKYALTTLERLRRYAAELGFNLPPEEEAGIWRLFNEQPEDMKRGMAERYRKTARGGYGVEKELARRLSSS